MAAQGEISARRLIGFAAPGAPLLALTLPPLVFLPPYFTNYLGVDLALVAAIFLGARLFDFIIDPLIGVLQDRTRHPFGRRRLWMAATTLPLCAAIWLLFIGFAPGTPPLALSISLLALYALFSAIEIAHLGWAGELSPAYHGRTRTLSAVQIAGAAGQIAILVLPAIVAIAGRNAPGASVHAMGWFLLVTLPASVALALAAAPEPAAQAQPALRLRDGVAALIGNRALRGVLAPDFMIGIAQGVSGGLFVFFIHNKLELKREAEILLLLYFVAALAGAPLWQLLAQRGSKHRAVQISCLYTAATFLIIPFMPAHNVWLAAPAMFAAGLGNAAPVMLLRAMMADVVDEDRLKTGAGRAGLFFGMLMTTSKLGQALGPACYGVLAAFGFDPKLGAANTGEAMLALTALFCALPAALNLLACVSLAAYPLDAERQRALRAAIEQLERQRQSAL